MFGIPNPFTSIGMKIQLGIILMLIAVGGAGYWYLTGTIKTKEQKIEELTTANTMLRVENAGLTAEIGLRKENDKLITGINKNLQDIKKQGSVIQDLYAEHDLERLAAKKPGLIERRVNSAVSNIFKDIEEMSKPESYTRNQPTIGPAAAPSTVPNKKEKKDEPF